MIGCRVSGCGLGTRVARPSAYLRFSKAGLSEVLHAKQSTLLSLQPVRQVTIQEFLALRKEGLLLDVRSPAEYEHAHIQGADSLPLFSNEERAAVGTAYKQQSRETAIKIGLDAFGPKMRTMVETVEELLGGQQRPVLLHCWRGGMRSQAVAWLLDLYGFDVVWLEGGYKAYRAWIRSHWQGQCFRLLAGNTGSGKTELLQALGRAGAPVLDLEALAGHKGSAFGGIGMPAQPSQEAFENKLGEALAELSAGCAPIWIEDESRQIGRVNIPNELFLQWPKTPSVWVYRSFEDRLSRIVAEYGNLDVTALRDAIVRIKKRLGPLETKTALAALDVNDIPAAFTILLHYYDKLYYPATREAALLEVDATGADPDALARKILEAQQ